MKRGIVVLVFALLIVSAACVIAEEIVTASADANAPAGEGASISTEGASVSPANIGDEINKGNQELKEWFNSLLSSSSKPDKMLDKVIVPEGIMASILKILFKVNGELNVQLLIILIAVWFIVFMVANYIFSAVNKTSNFSVFYSIGITFFLGFIGAIKLMSYGFIALGNKSNFLKDAGWGEMVFLALLIVVGFAIWYVGSLFMKALKENRDDEEARAGRMKVESGINAAESVGRAVSSQERDFEKQGYFDSESS
jgi:hypothetical protein